MIDLLLKKNLLPDWLIRVGIRRLLRQRLQEIDHPSPDLQVAQFAESLRSLPIAINTAESKEQHYEVPTRFYQLCLGPRLKYSSCYYERGDETLAIAEERMLALTCERARLADGLDILELGCGWGSLTLWMAERYPRARITGVSHSRTQREHILGEARRRGLANVQILTCDMNDFAPAAAAYDRVVSVEMFEHMKNWPRLMATVAHALRAEGLFFAHVFTHARFAYHFEVRDESDWMSRYFFTGGMMPAHGLFPCFQDDLKLVSDWKVNGQHYAQTAEHWLQNMDAHRAEIMPLFAETYGAAHARQWWAYWRVFYLACAELWWFRSGDEWLVSHYLFRKP
ncbi:Cyclopropane-fatty-acyl-phospholipid synthase [Lacunisphaera limnophila]|uniref:Cyclopropane-fatty-acyl-phospholipid synthase n=1 Tax=Lacunisphaera limnophila TaxID=1838286 RepID=A0A1D8ASN1_9BACT|nr:cyclopropane-fatty-acyl-phospholipid synthase family protein [Lacunisphaera limnophila]AOS43911.1 Cyclopropane-fatty-acyl-phospholipid synthase [Lacunisphaera limnophila]